MTGMTVRIGLLVCAFIMAACGQVATPIWEAAETEAVQETGAEVAVQPTEVPATEVPPTEVPPTEVPPTATPEPPTATPVPPTATTAPTVEPTEEPTEEPATDAGSVEGDPANGEALFVAGNASMGAPPCSTCHLANAETTLVGPGLLNVADRAAERKPGMSAVEYLHESIVEPSAYVVEGFVPGMMPDVYDVAFTEEEINDIVAYLMSLEG